ncbi:MAG: DUF5655 domain-containing protein [Actinomycetota bacterium]
MAIWTCDECGRSFGAVGRSHMCAPGSTLEDFVDGAVPWAGEVVELVLSHVRQLDGELIVDPLAEKILLKNGPTFALIGRMKRWVALSFNLRRSLSSGRLSRKTTEHAGGYWHTINVESADQIDDEVRAWLTEAFYGEEPSEAEGDSMFPDDVDVDFV